MGLFEAVGMAFGMIRAQKLKSFFSLVGVLIGVMFLVAVVSVVQGMNRYMVDRFANALVGANTFELRQRPSIVTGNVSDEVWLAWRRRPRISYADADYVRERLRTPATFSKYCEDRVAVHYEGKIAKDIHLVGSEATYFEIRNYEVTAGRAFTAQEVQTAQNGCGNQALHDDPGGKGARTAQQRAARSLHTRAECFTDAGLSFERQDRDRIKLAQK